MFQAWSQKVALMNGLKEDDNFVGTIEYNSKKEVMVFLSSAIDFFSFKFLHIFDVIEKKDNFFDCFVATEKIKKNFFSLQKIKITLGVHVLFRRIWNIQ